MPAKLAETTDWQSSVEQQYWFDRFSSQETKTSAAGIKFSQFQEFLKETLYPYFAKFPSDEQNSASGAKFTNQQEFQLFKLFDTKNDHLIDRNEFGILCQSWLDRTFNNSCALVVVDVQNDFTDGSLALINGPAKQDGAEVVPVINNLLATCKFGLVAYTLDWHPIDHISFQKLWPTHCVQNSWGAQLHPKLQLVPGAIFVEKGVLQNVDAYSAFWDNLHQNETNLRHELTSRGISDVFFCGLALDYCVAASALDSVKAGFVTFVVEDACRGIDCDEIARRKDEMASNGILLINSEAVRNYLSGNASTSFNRSLVIDVVYRRALVAGSRLVT